MTRALTSEQKRWARFLAQCYAVHGSTPVLAPQIREHAIRELDISSTRELDRKLGAVAGRQFGPYRATNVFDRVHRKQRWSIHREATP